MRIYLDNAASTQPDPEVLKAMFQVLENQYGNPSSIHAHGREAKNLIEQSRKAIARLLHAAPAEIFFTSGGTEAVNMAIQCGILTYHIKNVISSPLEHPAVLRTLERMQQSGLVRLHFVSVNHQGVVDLQHLEHLLQQTQKPSFVSLMQANNEIGTLTPIEEVGTLCERYQALYHSDTVQTIGHYTHCLNQSKVHFLVGSAHKFHGPKGVGFLYIKHQIQEKMQPLIFGGTQERNMRGGTEHVIGIVGMAKALQIAYDHMVPYQQHIQGLKTYMQAQLKACVPDLKFNGETHPSKSLYTILNVAFPETEMAELLVFNLDIAGVSASGGSACSSGSAIDSHVLRGIRADASRPSIRFSFSKYNTQQEIDYVLKQIKKIFCKQKNKAGIGHFSAHQA